MTFEQRKSDSPSFPAFDDTPDINDPTEDGKVQGKPSFTVTPRDRPQRRRQRSRSPLPNRNPRPRSRSRRSTSRSRVSSGRSYRDVVVVLCDGIEDDKWRNEIHRYNKAFVIYDGMLPFRNAAKTIAGSVAGIEPLAVAFQNAALATLTGSWSLDTFDKFLQSRETRKNVIIFGVSDAFTVQEMRRRGALLVGSDARFGQFGASAHEWVDRVCRSARDLSYWLKREYER
jgi:hypothetical protein